MNWNSIIIRYRLHLWNVALLVASAAIALAADRLVAAPRGAIGGATASSAVSPFVTAPSADSALPAFRSMPANDPLDPRDRGMTEEGVASDSPLPTVPPAPSQPRRLSAILIADERRIAVIDDTTVSVGDMLRDGARVSAIQADRVWLVEQNGRWHMLTLTVRGR